MRDPSDFLGGLGCDKSGMPKVGEIIQIQMKGDSYL
jgi:hypothetical protein